MVGTGHRPVNSISRLIRHVFTIAIADPLFCNCVSMPARAQTLDLVEEGRLEMTNCVICTEK